MIFFRKRGLIMKISSVRIEFWVREVRNVCFVCIILVYGIVEVGFGGGSGNLGNKRYEKWR